MTKRKAQVIIAAILLLVFVASQGFAAISPRTAINLWCLTATNTPNEVAAGPYPVKIAVIDSGVRQGVGANLATGFNYVFGTDVTSDLLGHGTQITGIIVGGSSEKGSLLALGTHATIVPLVWITKYPSGVVANGGISALCAAIRDAVDLYHCQIINISSGILTDAPDLRAAIAYAEEQGVIVVSAVGNSNHQEPDQVYYPAAYDTVVGVGSINRDLEVSPFSQRNSSVFITAPGERVYSLPGRFTSGFAQVSGTSYAAAYVSSFAALLLSRYPNLTPADFRRLLQESSQDLGELGYDTSYGHGIIDVNEGLTWCEELVYPLER